MESPATSFRFIIRDGTVNDVEACSQLDSSYSTDYVWQMNVEKSADRQHIYFRRERLPRPMETEYPINRERLDYAAQHSDNCFIVAANKQNQDVLGFLTMRIDPIHQIALIQDLLVARQYQRNNIGTRLLIVAQRWAKEHELRKMMVELQTKNFPGIQFCLSKGFVFSGFNDLYFTNHDIALFFGREI